MYKVYKFFLLIISLLSANSFININKPLLPSFSRGISKHNFVEFAKTNSISDKYVLIQSLINHIVLQKKDQLFDYCYKNLNYTDVMHVVISSDLEFIVKKHYYSKTVLELYDIIKANAELTDCYIKIHTLNNTKLYGVQTRTNK
jgi:hypothetical protein